MDNKQNRKVYIIHSDTSASEKYRSRLILSGTIFGGFIGLFVGLFFGLIIGVSIK